MYNTFKKRSIGRPFIEIPSVDWTKPNLRISRETGYSVMTVIKWRKKVGAKPLERGRPFNS